MMFLKTICSLLRQVHRSEQGAEGLEKLLIIGAIVLPLLGFLILFRNELTDFLVGNWSTVRDDSADGMTAP